MDVFELSDLEDFQDCPPSSLYLDAQIEESRILNRDDLQLPARVDRNWIYKGQYANAEEAKIVIKSERKWVYKRSTGNSIYYNCIRQKVQKCSAAIKIVLDSSTQSAVIWQAQDEHHHQMVNPARVKISQQQKEAIKDIFYQMNIKKPRGINGELRERGIPEVASGTLGVYLRRMRDGKNPRITTYYQLEKWCKTRSDLKENQFEAFGPDDPFILAYDVNENISPNHARVLISTKRLLLEGENAQLICTDATHKLNWNKLPSIVIGTVDKERHFHPLAIALSSHERSEDFGYFFTELKKYIEMAIDGQFDPHVLLADAADAITNGFELAFGSDSYTRVFCWAHVKRNIRKKCQSMLKNSSDLAKILSDLDYLQLSRNAEVFLKGFSLFKLKWAHRLEILKYIEDNWIDVHRNWFEGAAPGFPSTNNALESVNSSIKNEHSLRQQLPLEDYMKVLFDIMRRWSGDRNPESVNQKKFHHVPKLTRKLLENGRDWEAKTTTKRRNLEEGVIEFLTGAKSVPISEEQVSDFLSLAREMSWSSFDHFVQSEFNSMWKIRFDCEMWESAECSCPRFQKEYVCKHVVGLALRLRYLKKSRKYWSKPIGQKRGPGRPKKTRAGRSLAIE